jgi:acyl-CoA synthetase
LLAHLDVLGLSKYDMPEYFIQLSSFPLTASGKVLKRGLTEMVARREIEPISVRWRG